ncbi:tripartite tricarboxylate transporter substrate binding protein [Labrenzia aggregata]|uniref:Tripartite tricarboxylate transporter substrate binding protein n=2 Tax=Roseibium aggregatum TaxID=187304 RepID=A0A926NXY3_9HYPH|nr:tripartite tricarboxylate transporter substrate binding protein [Roseibium aggregatum]
MIRAIVAAGGLLLAPALATPALAQFPDKPVEMTVLFGGTANSIAQVLATELGNALGKPVVPVSRPGGGGAVGYSYVADTRPDGYNIVWNSNSINTAYHTGKIPFDYQKFTPIAMVSTEVPALAVKSGRGWKSLDELKAAAMKMDGKLKVGISGKGSFTQLVSAALFDAMGIGDKISYISYGNGKAPVELMAGRIDAAVQWPGQYKSYVDSGQLDVLAVTGKKRVALLPDAKTATEQGYDVDITMWRGLAAPKGTPPEVVKALQDAAKTAVESPAFLKAAKNLGFDITYEDSAAFGQDIAKDDAFYAKLLGQLELKKQ